MDKSLLTAQALRQTSQVQNSLDPHAFEAGALGSDRSLADWYACFEDLRREYEAVWAAKGGQWPASSRRSRSALHWDGAALHFDHEDAHAMGLSRPGGLSQQKEYLALLLQRITGQSAAPTSRWTVPAWWSRLLGRA